MRKRSFEETLIERRVTVVAAGLLTVAMVGAVVMYVFGRWSVWPALILMAGTVLVLVLMVRFYIFGTADE